MGLSAVELASNGIETVNSNFTVIERFVASLYQIRSNRSMTVNDVRFELYESSPCATIISENSLPQKMR